MHGFKLADVEYFHDNDFMHPLVKRCYVLLKNFVDAKGIMVNYETLGFNFTIGIFRNIKKENTDYFINVFCNNHCVTGALTLSSDDTDKYNDLLVLTPKNIEIVYLNSTGKKFERKVDVTSSIL